jgi:hypothetical protein
MKVYSDFSARRTVQITADVIALVAITIFIWLGVTVFQLIAAFASLGADLENAGSGFRETMVDVGETLGAVPLIGSGIRGPFDQASGAGETLESVGQSAQVAVHQVAVGAGLATALVPILFVLVVWFLPRLRFIRRASAAQRLVNAGAPRELLALRALTHRSVAAVQSVDSDALAAWRRGDARIVRELAALELRAAGVRL